MSTAITRRNGGALRTWDPFAELSDLGSRMSRLFDVDLSRAGQESFVPGVDLEETDDAFVVELDLAGVAKDDITIDLAGRRLTVHGERKEKERTGTLRRSTRVTGEFSYELLLPGQVDEKAVTASMTGGVLTITLPKSSEEKPTHITVS